MTGYLYVVLWFAVGLLLLFRFGKENKIFYFLGGFFILLGFWWLADTVTESALFEGVWGWVLRGVTAVALILACKVYYDETKRSREADETAEREQAEARRAAMLPRAQDEPLSVEAGEDSGENGSEASGALGGDAPGTDASGADASGADASGADAPGGDAGED